MKKRRKHRHQIHTPTDSEAYHSSQERATASKDRICTAEQPPLQPVKTAQRESTAEEEVYLKLTHTYTIAETVYKAVSATIQAGHELDHHRTTWALSQISTTAALQIFSDIPYTSCMRPQQYIERCAEEAFAEQGTPQHTPPQQMHRKKEWWSAHFIAEQFEEWAWRPSTRPAGLVPIRQGAFRLADVMMCWGYNQELTKAEVIEAITDSSNVAGISRFRLTTENQYTIITVVSKPRLGPIGQARHGHAKPRFKPPTTMR